MIWRVSSVTGSRATGSAAPAAARVAGARRRQRDAIPAAGEKHADLVGGRRPHRPVARLDRGAAAQFRQQLFGAAPVQVAQHAVVVEDGHLGLRKQHGKEIAVRAFAAACFCHPFGGGGAMMAVGDIERRQRLDRARSAPRWSASSPITQS